MKVRMKTIHNGKEVLTEATVLGEIPKAQMEQWQNTHGLKSPPRDCYYVEFTHGDAVHRGLWPMSECEVVPEIDSVPE